MGLRCLLCLLVIGTSLRVSEGMKLRSRRQAAGNLLPESRAYQPPISLGTVPVTSSAALQNSYQPPISLIRSNEYQSPLQHGDPRQYQPQPQVYVLPNQPVQYVPPPQQSYSVFQQPQPATSYSVHQQPPQGPSSFMLSDSRPPQSSGERTYSTAHSKVSHVPAQAIHKAPASEIQADKKEKAKEKDKSNDEYVVYYYYYYDNDTAANNNLSLNFDDIPSLESYDGDKKEPEKTGRQLNAVAVAPTSKPDTRASETSQPRSVGNTRPLDDEAVVQPLRPISNVFRYGSNEVPRFPVLPNFIVTEAPSTSRPEAPTSDALTTEPPPTPPAVQPDLKTGDEADDHLNSVLDNASDLKSADEKEEEQSTTTSTTTTTTTELPTTTEEPTTTTERSSRRRPSLGGGGGRRRFNPSPTSSFSPSRTRQGSGRSSSSTSTTSTTTTTTSSTPTRRSFGASNRVRPRPPIGSNRPRPGSRSSTTEAGEEKTSESSTPTSASTTSTTSSSRSRFTSASPRRFQSSRSRSQSTTSSTTSTTTRAPVSRSRSTSRPRPNLISNRRPPRPGFPLRSRPGSEPEEPETTTPPPPPTEEETSPETSRDELPSTDEDNESNETDEDNETSAEETEEPTTTEGSRFSALFRPRNRSALGNRPRPVVGNRPPRS